MKSLRESLEELDDLGFDAIEKLRGEINHSIQLVERQPPPGQPNFNCVMYALNLSADELVIAIARSYSIRRATPARDNDSSIFADTEFLEFCAHEGSLRPTTHLAYRPGDVLVYANQGQFRHVGKVVKHGRVRSKWGTYDLLEHEPLEVRSSYGSDLRLFEGLTCEQSRDSFINYAWSVVDSDERSQEHLEYEINKYG